MDIRTLKTIATNLPPHIAVLMQGPTGVGKSFAARAVAKELVAVLYDLVRAADELEVVPA